MTWTPAQRRQANDLVALTYANPFSPTRLQLEHRLLGKPKPGRGDGWHLQTGGGAERFAQLAALAEHLLLRAPTSEHDLREGLAVYALYERFREQMTEAVTRGPSASLPWHRDFVRCARDWLPRSLGDADIDHLLACQLQICRAFQAIFANLIGASRPMVDLRAACWASIFGADLRLYRRSLWQRMRDFPTLITGPTGTGKERVAEVIGRSGYIAVDARRKRLVGGDAPHFLPLAINTLSPTLVEAELFGHRRGAFTGANDERPGWLEVCPDYGCVFLDEIGEVDPTLQVKLLRVLQTRIFARVGEQTERRFTGRLVAATNRDLDAEIAAGRFRADVYYRLCADRIVTPALADLLAEHDDELERLCSILAERILGPDEGPAFAERSAAWIRQHLGPGYAWPGNVRELEQCLRSLVLRGSYQPQQGDGGASLAADLAAARLSADDLLNAYCAQASAVHGGFRPAARVLGLDWRTVKKRAAADQA